MAKRFSLFFGLLFWSAIGLAQLEEHQAIYTNPTDQLLTIRKIAILPSVDNIGGIYSRPLEEHIRKIIRLDHRFDLASTENIGPVYSPSELRDNPEKVKEISRYLEADVLLASQLIKGPRGISLNVSMYLTDNGQLLAESNLEETKKFDISSLKRETQKLVGQVIKRIPYDGLIMSRTNQTVTINLGERDGLKKGSILTVVQIIKAEYHPKFKFLISTEKEVLGKLKVAKVDKTLSFAKIITEIEKKAIQKNAKISGIDFVSYDPNDLSLGEQKDDLSARPDSSISFGPKAKEWVPQRPPTFGAVSAHLGFGSFGSDVRRSGSSYTTNDSFAKNIKFAGELWMDPKYSLHIGIEQGIVSNNSVAKYDFAVGYNFRFTNDIWGSKIELLGGFASYIVDVEDVSSTVTKLNYSGLRLGLSGMFPLTLNNEWAAGGKLFIFISPSVTQTPKVGSVRSTTANHFSIFVHKKMGINWKLQGTLDIELYTAKFSGSTSNSSQEQTTLSGGVTYLF
tara:strand:- start:11594 stop:13120 length:1527 start_codon:yes stop_codon:yes gene_type:complete